MGIICQIPNLVIKITFSKNKSFFIITPTKVNHNNLEKRLYRMFPDKMKSYQNAERWDQLRLN